ncbi:MAG: hypothetical protein R3F05_20330 [Planctomycetota bacterium]
MAEGQIVRDVVLHAGPFFEVAGQVVDPGGRRGSACGSRCRTS